MSVGFIIPRASQQKPPLGTQIDWNGPLSRGLLDCLLFNEFSGNAVNNLAVPFNAVANGAPKWVGTRYGIGAYCTGGTGYDIPDHTPIFANTGFSVRVLFVPVTWPGGFTCIIDKGTNGSTRELGIFAGTSGQISFVNFGAAGSAPGIGAMSLGVLNDLVLTVAASGSSNLSIYVNGRLSGTSSVVTGSSGSAAVTSIGRNATGGGSNSDSKYLMYQLWSNRLLTPVEVAELYAEPYSMFLPTGPRKFYSVQTNVINPGLQNCGGMAGNKIGNRIGGRM